MKLWMHAVLALLQFVSACFGALCLLILWEVFLWVKHGYGEFPLPVSDREILLVPLLIIEGFILGAIPSYISARKSLETRLLVPFSAPLALGLGFMQGVLFPLVLAAIGGMVAAMEWLTADRLLADGFWWFLAIFLALVAVASAVASALLMQMLLAKRHSSRV
jgi:hypothetical protein